MKIALLIRCLELGGAERQLSLLARGLHERGHQVSVLVFYGGGPLEADLDAAGVTVVDLAKAGRWDLLGVALRLRAWLKRERPQALYSFLDTPNLMAAWIGPSCPGLKVVWGVRASDMDLSRYDWFARLSHGLLGLSARGAAAIIVNSQSGAALWERQGWPSAKLRVIPNGIDLAHFHPQAEAGARVRAQWGVDPAAPLMGLVARLDPMKDHPTFLKAAALVLAQRPQARFVCVGGGPRPQAQALADQARGLGLHEALIWAGSRQDMPAVFNALDVCLLTSAFGEGLPNAVAEAMATAKPCVVTAVGDAPWLLGRPELVAPIGDAAGLAGRCLELLALPPAELARLGRELRQRVRGEFSLERMVEATERALLEVAGS
ncbi:MAG: glycosyltransferase [Desulfarculus sp.]|nr:glycosyltransferase [Desulfarculus sp.]